MGVNGLKKLANFVRTTKHIFSHCRFDQISVIYTLSLLWPESSENVSFICTSKNLRLGRYAACLHTSHDSSAVKQSRSGMRDNTVCAIRIFLSSGFVSNRWEFQVFRHGLWGSLTKVD